MRMKNIVLLISGVLLAAPAAAAPTCEAAAASAEQSFQSLPSLQLSFQKGAKAAEPLAGKAVAAPARKPVRVQQSNYVSVSGYVNLSGTGFVSNPQGSGFASKPFSPSRIRNSA